MIENILNNNDLIKWLTAVSIIVAVLALIFMINKLFKGVYLKVYRLKGDRIKEIKYKNYQIISAEYSVKIIISTIKIIRAILILVIIYLCLPLIFSVLPWTEHIADNLITLMLTPLKIIVNALLDYLPNLFFIVVTFIIIRFLSRVLKYFATEIERERLVIKGFYKEWSRPTFSLIKVILYIFSLVVIFPYLPGSNSPAFQGISIFVGVLLSLGSTALVSNAVGGLMIIYMRPFIKGDVIKVGDFTGTVVSKNMLVTRIKTFKE